MKSNGKFEKGKELENLTNWKFNLLNKIIVEICISCKFKKKRKISLSKCKEKREEKERLIKE